MLAEQRPRSSNSCRLRAWISFAAPHQLTSADRKVSFLRPLQGRRFGGRRGVRWGTPRCRHPVPTRSGRSGTLRGRVSIGINGSGTLGVLRNQKVVATIVTFNSGSCFFWLESRCAEGNPFPGGAMSCGSDTVAKCSVS